jgi:Peptidase C13 family
MNEPDSALPPIDTATYTDAVPRTWFGGLLRLWCLRPVRSAPKGQAIPATVLMSAAWLAFWIAIDRWQVQPNPVFLPDGIALLAWYALALLSLAALLRWRCRSSTRPAFAPTLTLTMGIVPAPLLLYTVAAGYLNFSWFMAASLTVGIYVFLYIARGLKALTGERQRGAALIGVSFLTAFIWLTDELNVIPDLWIAGQTQAARSTDASEDGEALLFRQAALIDAALPPVKADAAAKPRAFFVGFAGVGDEKVFAQEIGLAARVLGERYRIDNRTLSLINDERDLQSAPLATVTGLKYALRGIASRMNRDRDVLFLSISSHGSDDPLIAVSNSQLPLQDLTDAELADALRASAIQWRVIILSACYAGAFIDSLRDPQTIVITAAAADRTSFGCSNDRDLTYFGEAFYRDALPSAGSLHDAFDRAKAAITERERAEHITASNPQAYFGKKMEEKLKSLDAH